MTARPRSLLSLPSPLRLLVALIVLIAGIATGGNITRAENGVAAITPESSATVGAGTGIAAGHVGSERLLFDDGVSGCCVAPRTVAQPVTTQSIFCVQWAFASLTPSRRLESSYRVPTVWKEGSSR